MPVVTDKLGQQLARVNGVVIPSKLPEGQQPLKALRTRPRSDGKLDRARDKTCPICGHTSTRPEFIRSHFVACVKTNGNPTGARWDDNLNFMPRPDLVKRKHNDVDESDNTDSPSSKRTARSPTTKEQRDVRQRQYRERLAAVNGVVIPSRLAPGETPTRRNYEPSANRKYQCPICGGYYGRKEHVQSHFAVCVETNGNPTGARWDEAWNGAPSRPERASASTQVSEESQDHQMQDLQSGDYQLSDIGYDGLTMNMSLLNGYEQNEPQSTSPPSNSFEPYHPNIEDLDPQLVFSFSDDLQPCHPTDRKGTSTEPYHPDLGNLDPQLWSSPSDDSQPYDPNLRMETI
ncbi:hypothetical protein HO173_013032 [Letharia columbiana]|uniref:C2H2-type domain-containing protein n=1 Tax=Letharia columbiana TaxID=112416 RepID=A0A8H6CJA5_9LECA|nr:uncharacterized protein HO173_013032 [Letharia columbiana]KAF6224543.1 hypothetical protein HO173_013032 [Letharia columbiana]